MQLMDVPPTTDILPDDQLNQLIAFFKQKSEVDKADPYGLAMAFAGISDFLVMRSDQLG
jgi:hypothetical protein